MKHFYYVIMATKNEKYYAYVVEINKENAIPTHWVTSGKVYPRETKKKAEELANYWNECYKANGTYMF